MNKTSTISLLLLLATQTANATDLEINHKYQSNPYRLSEDFAGSRLVNARFYHNGKKELPNRREFQFSAELDHNRFLDIANADSTTARIRGRLVNRLKFGDRSASILLTADAGTKRLSYIDQRTGEPLATSRGANIQDRFAYNFLKPSAEFTYRWNRQLSVGVFTAVERRDYVNDYSILGLEALDYTEFTVQPTFRYKTENGYSRAYVYNRVRHYDDRLVDDINGRNIAGSTASFTLTGFGLSHKRQMSDQWTLEASLSAYSLSDNGVGYTDMQSRTLSVSSLHQLTNSGALDIRGRCNQRDNENMRVVNFEEQEFGRSSNGCRVSAGYEQPFNVENRRLRWRVEAIRSWEDNSETLRSYTQWGLSIGVNYRW